MADGSNLAKMEVPESDLPEVPKPQIEHCSTRRTH